MVDCETLGTLPNRNPVLQIAAVQFNPETFEPLLNEDQSINSFECFLSLREQIQFGRTPDADTVKWWQKPDKAEVAKIVFAGVSNAPNMVETMNTFSDWISNNCKLENGFAEAVFWAKPVAFDYPFIDGLFLDSGVPSPFHFRKVMDMHSYIISALKATHYALNHYQLSQHVATEIYWATFEKTKKAHKGRKDAHNASADCIFQLDWLKEVMDNCAHYVSENGIKEVLTRKD